MSVFFLFMLATVLGILTTLYWIPEDDLGRGYFQMNALIVLGFLSLVIAVVSLQSFEPFGPRPAPGVAALWVGFISAFLNYAAVWKERWRLGRLPLTASLLGCGIALLYAGRILIVGPSPLPFRELLTVAALGSSALLLGWSLVAMLLGHWYLVAPGLTFRHLVVFCRVLVGTVVLRMLAVAATLASAYSVEVMVEPHPLRTLTTMQGQGMFFWFRILWGLAIPLALAAMSLHCARRRSNQSATGILYVLVVGTFIGELTGYYLAVTTGVPP